MTLAPLTHDAALALLRWYQDAGVVTAEADIASSYDQWPDGGLRVWRPDPLDARRPSAPAKPPATAISADDAPMPTDDAVQLSTQLAAQATSIQALKTAIEGFDGCHLKGGARSTVVYDGVPGAPVLVLGEAPGRDEDRVGRPFVGRAGQLLDRMLASIGVSRDPNDDLESVCITNSIYWRPPGNRNPTKAEVAICQPFVRRFIALSKPKVILLTGNVSTQALFPDAPGITRSRGKWRSITVESGVEIPALPIFHPAFLLRQPSQKKLAWLDLLSASARLH